MPTKESIMQVLKEIFLVLSEKERNIINKRFSLENPEKKTLEQIGQEYSITRERVRQIEKNAISKLRRTAMQSSLKSLFEAANEIVAEKGGVSDEEQIISELASLIEGYDTNFLRLSLEINPDLEKIKKSKTYVKGWFLKSKASRKEILLINSEAEKLLKSKKEILSEDEFTKSLLEQVQTKDKSIKSKALILSSLSISTRVKKVKEGFGLTSWRSVKPKSIRDKALIVLARKGKSMHFKDIAKLIKEENFDSKSVTVQAVHNELIRYEDFVLIGRGIYALKQWGYKEGTVKDVIKDVLKENGELDKSTIVEEVLKRRHVKIGTISLNLQKYPEFKRVGRAVYTLAK